MIETRGVAEMPRVFYFRLLIVSILNYKVKYG